MLVVCVIQGLRRELSPLPGGGEGKVSCDKSPTKLESTPHLSADVDGLVFGWGERRTIAPAASSRRCRGELLMTEHHQIMEAWP